MPQTVPEIRQVKADYREITRDLFVPEGPIVMDDGSVICVEMGRGTLSRVLPGGEIVVIAELGGGPNGAAVGPDGAIYVCNSGGDNWVRNLDGPSHYTLGDASRYTGGRVERVDPQTGASRVLYESCNGRRLTGPNDLVFDAHGGFYFTDCGKIRLYDMDRGGLYYAQPDGSSIQEVDFGLLTPNGVGLSPDGQTLYVSETLTGRLWAYDIEAPGRIRPDPGGFLSRGRLLMALPGIQMFDSFAVDSEGHICAAIQGDGAVFRISPDGRDIAEYPMPDAFMTNLAFGGPDLRTAYITMGSTGRLVSMQWPVPGLPLNFLNTL